MKKQTCKDCRYFEQNDNHWIEDLKKYYQGICRRFPMILSSDGLPRYTDTDEKGWCGEHKPTLKTGDKGRAS